MSSADSPRSTNCPEQSTRKCSALRHESLEKSDGVDDDIVFVNCSESDNTNNTSRNLNPETRREDEGMECMTCERPLSQRQIVQAKIKYHFMNPFQKYRARGRKPWKLMIQIFKVIFVTLQVCMHAYTT